MAKYVMNVDVGLGSLSMNVFQTGKEPLPFVSSVGENTDDQLLVVKYVRAQQLSPEFQTTYEGINQSVDIKISTVIFRAAPEPVISLYDFIMNTFVPNRGTPPPEIEPSPEASPDIDSGEPSPVSAQGAIEKIRVPQLRSARRCTAESRLGRE